MAEKDLIQLSGTIIELLPNTHFRTKLDNGNIIIAHASGKIRKHRIRLIVGDKVNVEITPYDLTKGRIIHRL